MRKDVSEKTLDKHISARAIECRVTVAAPSNLIMHVSVTRDYAMVFNLLSLVSKRYQNSPSNWSERFSVIPNNNNKNN